MDATSIAVIVALIAVVQVAMRLLETVLLRRHNNNTIRGENVWVRAERIQDGIVKSVSEAATTQRAVASVVSDMIVLLRDLHADMIVKRATKEEEKRGHSNR